MTSPTSLKSSPENWLTWMAPIGYGSESPLV